MALKLTKIEDFLNRDYKICVATLLLGCSLLLTSARGGENVHNLSSKSSHLVREWINAVSSGNGKLAISIANKFSLAEPSQPQPSPMEYKKLCEENGLKVSYLDLSFNATDYQSWSHALFFQLKAQDLTRGKKDIIPTLFTAVTDRVEGVEPPQKEILWPFRIWDMRKGVCDRQAWVLCELAYQCGYQTQIVYLQDPKTKVSPHTICELRKDAEVWTADPFSNILLQNIAISDLRDTPDLAQKTWPENKKWQEAIADPVFLTPSYPQDYCQRNQKLYKIINKKAPRTAPRFGEDPNQRRMAYRNLFSNKDKEDAAMSLWHYPFRLLALQIAKSGTE